jgi:hypothetical protein
MARTSCIRIGELITGIIEVVRRKLAKQPKIQRKIHCVVIHDITFASAYKMRRK